MKLTYVESVGVKKLEKHEKTVKFVDDEENEVEIKVGTTYYIDYGNNFHGELSYFHHGLCTYTRRLVWDGVKSIHCFHVGGRAS